MGCCFSCEEDDDRRRRFPNHPTLSSPPSRGAVPTPAPRAPSVRAPSIRAPSIQAPSLTDFDSPRNYDYTPREVYVRCVPPQRPVVPAIRKPTPTASSTRSTHVPKPVEFKPKPGALYGEYKCKCGYFWVSRLSWRDRYQQCKRCKKQVRPRNQRELQPSDFTSRDKFDESLAHPQELCEMCKQVGGYCGRYK